VDGWLIEKSKHKPTFLSWPFIRGTVNLVDTFIMGVKILVYSANQSLDDGEEEESLSNTEIALSVAAALGLGAVLFFLLPAFLAQVIRSWAPGRVVQNILEGAMRMGIFVVYIYAISKVKDIQRVYQYHGAEHKTIFTFEAGLPLELDHARGMSRLHPRCGTSFLLLVIVVSILFYSLLPPMSMVQRLLSRLILLPVIAGVAYELIRIAGRKMDNPLVAAFSWPGMQLQRLTTQEPDDSQLEVAIAALIKVLQDDGLLPQPAVEEAPAGEEAAAAVEEAVVVEVATAAEPAPAYPHEPSTDSSPEP
jgi:uncharacterized protein YqhQ